MKKLIALALLLTACADFVPGSLITETRLLGAQVRVEGDPERTTPRPGETANLELVLDGVVMAPVVSWSLAVCLPTASVQEPCPANVLTRAQGVGTPSLRVVVPADSALGTAHSLHVSGVICTQGDLASCEGKTVPLVYELLLAREADGSDENLQPNVEQTRFRFDGKDWPAGEALARGCAQQAELPWAVADEKEHRITIELGPNARELYLGADEQAIYEELQLSTFVDGGELERQYSFVSPDDDRERPSLEVKWTAPTRKQLQGEDRGVRLLVLVRDSRGGLAQLERALCSVRKASGQLSGGR